MTQDGQDISCSLKKFNEGQMEYPTTEQELLVIMESLKYHHSIIYVGEVILKTNHVNLTENTAQHTYQCVLHVY